MSSDFYAFDASFHRHSNSDLVVSSDGGEDLLFFSDTDTWPYPFPFFDGSLTDVSQDNSNHQNPLGETLASSLDPLSPSFFSFSPPSTHLENLSLSQANPNRVLQPLSNGPNLESEFGSFSSFDVLSEVKSEECQMGFDYTYKNQHFLPHSYSGSENVSKLVQRSFSSNCFDENPGGLPFQPHRDTLMDSPNFQRQALSSPERSFFNGKTRRVCSTGDLQNMKANDHRSERESSLLEEANFKVGRYSAEERKERISKYRAKRSRRNFNKTIKYACRKTLADNRPRIRGRFARNDEPSETSKPPGSTQDEDEEEDEFWLEKLWSLSVSSDAAFEF